MVCSLQEFPRVERITSDKIGIISRRSSMCLELEQKTAYASSEAERYETLYVHGGWTRSN